MNTDWLRAWWRQILRHAPGDPWNEDPEILAERYRQHRDGVTDKATAWRLEADFWRRYGAPPSSQTNRQREQPGSR